jgi:hypothetical protein
MINRTLLNLKMKNVKRLHILQFSCRVGAYFASLGRNGIYTVLSRLVSWAQRSKKKSPLHAEPTGASTTLLPHCWGTGDYDDAIFSLITHASLRFMTQ